jgi:hypothetical protein
MDNYITEQIYATKELTAERTELEVRVEQEQFTGLFHILPLESFK